MTLSISSCTFSWMLGCLMRCNRIHLMLLVLVSVTATESSLTYNANWWLWKCRKVAGMCLRRKLLHLFSSLAHDQALQERTEILQHGVEFKKALKGAQVKVTSFPLHLSKQLIDKISRLIRVRFPVVFFHQIFVDFCISVFLDIQWLCLQQPHLLF